MKGLTVKQKILLIIWIAVGIFTLLFSIAAMIYLVRETAARHINWSE